jgi:hypothetical protein
MCRTTYTFIYLPASCTGVDVQPNAKKAARHQVFMDNEWERECVTCCHSPAVLTFQYLLYHPGSTEKVEMYRK